MGGGGGGSYGISLSDLGKYEQVAKDALKVGAGESKHNVFISFVSEDLDEVNLLRGQAKNENSDLEFNDWSLQEPFDSKNAEYIKRGIRERIRQSSVTVVYVSDSTAGSKWVDWEIRESIALGKGVIALHKATPLQPGCRTPSLKIEFPSCLGKRTPSCKRLNKRRDRRSGRPIAWEDRRVHSLVGGWCQYVVTKGQVVR